MSDFDSHLSNSLEASQLSSSKDQVYSQGPYELDITQVAIRRSDADDCQVLERVIDRGTQGQLDLLFNYPRLIQRVETCFLSITLIDSEYRVVGMAIFEDYPQGLEGTFDYLHENAWEQWLEQAYHIREDFDIRPFNSLWLVYFYLGK
jgi:hypothetical protein